MTGSYVAAKKKPVSKITVVAEMLGAYRGLGWTISQSVQQIDFLAV